MGGNKFFLSFQWKPSDDFPFQLFSGDTYVCIYIQIWICFANFLFPGTTYPQNEAKRPEIVSREKIV